MKRSREWTRVEEVRCLWRNRKIDYLSRYDFTNGVFAKRYE